jgi:hypothetical protein
MVWLWPTSLFSPSNANQCCLLDVTLFLGPHCLKIVSLHVSIRLTRMAFSLSNGGASYLPFESLVAWMVWLWPTSLFSPSNANQCCLLDVTLFLGPHCLKIVSLHVTIHLTRISFS